MSELEVQKLLQRYFEGGTSLCEEQALHKFFTEEKIPDSLKVYQPLFTFFKEEQTIEPPMPKDKGRTLRLSWIIVTSIAASLAILFLIRLPQTQQEQYAYYIDGHRVYDESAALESAEDKLQLLATSMQKARNSMSAFEKVQESNHSLQQLSKISSAYQHIERMVSGSKSQDTASLQ